MHDMQSLWSRLEAVAQQAGRSLKLRGPASEKVVAKAERELGFALPAEYRASVLLHDGEDEEASFEWLPGCAPLKSLEDVMAQWRYEQGLIENLEGEPEIEGPLYTVLWHPRRLPIAGNRWWDGDNTYVDMHPAPAGREGQIITFVTECDLVCIGQSFGDAIARYLKALESGDWIWSEAKGHVTPRNEAANTYPNESNQWAQYLEGGVRPRTKPTAKAKPAAKSKAKTKPTAKTGPAKASAKPKTKAKAKANAKPKTKAKANAKSKADAKPANAKAKAKAKR